MTKGNYLGSPALAMNVLGKQAKRFVFFDLEKSALENVDIYAKQIELSTSVEIHYTDSLKGTIELLPSLPASSFIHIDPYEIDKKGEPRNFLLPFLYFPVGNKWNLLEICHHLILCEVLRNEAPQVYVETNSACAIYSMTQTPEQQYGIYHFRVFQ